MSKLKEKISEITILHGKYTAGNTRGDKEGWEIELPLHKVSLTYDFSVQIALITFNDYEQFCREQKTSPPSDFCPKVGYALGRGVKPVLNISWWDAIAYCNWLSLKNNLPVAYRLKDQENPGALVDEENVVTEDITQTKGYRLLTEAEWEYTARGGHLIHRDFKYSGGNSLESIGWFWKNSGERFISLSEKKWNATVITKNHSKPQPVMTKKPNNLNIFDMSGNVWEWCHDWFGEYTKKSLKNPIGPSRGSNKVIRGGSWFFGEHFCRVSSRFYGSPNCLDFQTGVRLARTL